MAARIYDFPILIGEDEIDESEHVWTDEEIIRGYEENYQYEEDAYYHNWIRKKEQERNEQKREQTCLICKFVHKLTSLFH